MSPISSDIVIAVMGITGVGKSSFIKTVSGRRDIIVGHKISSGLADIPTEKWRSSFDLRSATEFVTPYEFQYAGINFTLVDTPGFDDSRCTDDVIANRLLEWLRQSMQQSKRLSGIIYLHRIIDPRTQGTALSNMNMFRRLCGSDCFPNVVLATSFWSEVDPTEGARRERELCETDEFWGQLVKKGSRVVRIGLDDKADQRLLLRIAQNKKVVFQAQQDMLDGRQNCETSAAQEANGNLSRYRQYFDAQLEAEKENFKRKLEEMGKRREEQLEEQKASFREQYQAQKQARRKYEADNAAMKRDEEKFASQQSGLQRLREAHKGEKIRLDKLKQEQQKYYDYKCIRTKKHRGRRRVTCDNCKRTIKDHRSQFYHCCYCRNDNFDLCVDCGPQCEDCEHPPMKLCGGTK